jgi:hypothetical protein
LLPSRVEESPAAAESCLIDMDRVTLRSPAVLLCFLNELLQVGRYRDRDRDKDRNKETTRCLTLLLFSSLQLIRQVNEPRVLVIAQKLVVRYLQHNPRYIFSSSSFSLPSLSITHDAFFRDAERVLEVWLECLSSPSAAVRKAALTHAPELFPTAAGNRKESRRQDENRKLGLILL